MKIWDYYNMKMGWVGGGWVGGVGLSGNTKVYILVIWIDHIYIESET